MTTTRPPCAVTAKESVMVESNDAAVEALAKVLADEFDEWLHRMHGVISSCDHKTEGEAMARAVLASGVVVPATERCSTCQQSRERCESTPRWGGDDHTFTPDFKQPAGSAVDELRDIKAAAMTKTTEEAS